ncbi:MAG: hypothetical protein MZV63_15500 [Marinilabiliales bacterium]|nr:hypothetical protein [Marinilabiliales bacterium]
MAKLEKEALAATELVKTTEARNQLLLTENARMSAANDLLEGRIEESDAKISSLTARIQELEAQEPSYPELVSHPLVVNLRSQIAEHKARYSLAQEDIAELKTVIINQRVMYNNLLVAYSNRGEALQETISAMNLGLSTSRELASENKKLKRWLKIGGYAVGEYASLEVTHSTVAEVGHVRFPVGVN